MLATEDIDQKKNWRWEKAGEGEEGKGEEGKGEEKGEGKGEGEGHWQK